MTTNIKCLKYKTCDYAIATNSCISDKGGLCRGDTRLDTTPLEQCNTCRLEGKRSCMYHGYPSSQIPNSCSYKMGINAEEALRNLDETFIDEHWRELVMSDIIVDELKSTIRCNSKWGGDLEPYYMGVNAMCNRILYLISNGDKK